jgi:hypothetical protein
LNVNKHCKETNKIFFIGCVVFEGVNIDKTTTFKNSIERAIAKNPGARDYNIDLFKRTFYGFSLDSSHSK